MTRIAFFLLWISLADSVHAQTVPVRSGEHPEFTRIVLDVPQGTVWDLKKSATGYDLAFEDASLKADTSSAFKRISRDRVSAITQSDKTVSFSLNCDCTAKAYILRNNMLVIDFTESPEIAEANPVIPESADAEIEASEPDFEFGDLLWRERPAASVFDDEIRDQPDASNTADLDLHDVATPASTLREQITNQVAHAATIGILQPEQVEIETPKVDRLDPKSASTPAPQTQATQSNMVFRNSTTLLTTEVLGSPVDAMTAIVCPDPAELDLASWVDDEDFDTQLSKLRSALFEEFDRTSSDAAIELTKTYIHYGFGQEALQSLGMLDPALPKADTLRALAEILEHGHTITLDPFSNFASCAGPVALWAALARPSPKIDLEDNRNSILTALDALPLHLREYLGPMLARRATEAGATELADRALRMATRARNVPTPEQALASAELDVKTQQPEAAIETLEEIVQSNSAVSAKATIQLIETNLLQDTGVTEDTARLVEALSIELGQTDLGPELRRAQTIARAQLGEFEIAFGHLALLANQDLPELVQHTKKDLLTILTKNASDADFVVHAFDLASGSIINDLDLKRAVANRFASLGFSDVALGGLLAIPEGNRTREDNLLLSRLALQNRKPREALSHLEGLTDPDAEALRAQAMELLGDYNSAAALFASANQPENSERSAWMAEDWDALTMSDTSRFQSAALALSSAQDSTEVEGMIERSESLLRDSANLRDALNSVVQEPPSN